MEKEWQLESSLVGWVDALTQVTWRVILTKQIYMRDPNRFSGMWDCLFWTPGFGIFLKKPKNCLLPIFVIEFCITGVNGQIWLFYPENCLSLPPPGNFAGKRVLKLVERFSSQFFFFLPQSCLQIVQFAAFWSRCKIFACEVRAYAESKTPFRFLSHLLSLFLPHFFFFCWAFN